VARIYLTEIKQSLNSHNITDETIINYNTVPNENKALVLKEKNVLIGTINNGKGLRS